MESTQLSCNRSQITILKDELLDLSETSLGGLLNFDPDKDYHFEEMIVDPFEGRDGDDEDISNASILSISSSQASTTSAKKRRKSATVEES